MSARRAAVDLGTNSAQLLVVDGADVLLDRVEIVGLGRGLQDRGALAPDRIDRAVDVLAGFAAQVRALGVAPADVVVFATSAARRAANARALCDRVEAATGWVVHVIDGETEGRLTLRGVLSDPAAVPRDGDAALVIDVGGGSTELAVGARQGPVHVDTLEIGAVRLTERWLGTGTHDPAGVRPMHDAIERAFDPVRARPPGLPVFGVAGSATTLATVLLGHDRWRPEAVHGATVSLHDLEALVGRLLPMTPDARAAAVPVAPERAVYLVAGASILAAALRRVGALHLTVSLRDLRWGAVR